MPYTVKQLAKLSGVSVRTLHYYDEVGLLKPARQAKNGYRYYGDKELLTLQQILFFRELEFPLDEIKRIIASPQFDMAAALRDQRKLMELKKKRLDGLMKTIDKTLKKMKQEIFMEDKDLYGTLSKQEMDQYAEEAKQRWGHTDAYKQSQERVKKMGKEGLKRVAEEGDKLMKQMVAIMDQGPKSDAAQQLIAKHYNGLRAFYEPSLEMYRGLGQMYVDDPRFTAFYTKYHPDMAVFMRDAMHHYADTQESK